jgi:adenine specific DNA methylase Mod
MEIKKEFIGCKCWSPTMERYVKIEANKGELYMALGIFYIYEFETPNLVKINDVKNTKKRNNTAGGDGDGIDNDSESELLV